MLDLRTVSATSLLLLLLLALPIAACGGDERAAGSPPVVRALDLSPTNASVGALETMRGSLAFEDPDADVLELHSTITAPDGTRTDVPPASVAGARGLAAGSVTVQLSVQFVAEGTHTVTVWLRDSQGNDSNTLDAAIEVGP